MNKVILMGRLTRDPEVRYTDGGTTVARFSLAVDRRFKREGGPEADFFNCTSFGKQAEFIEKYLRKGTKIALTGSIENNNYTNKDGEKVYSIQVMVEELEFAESKAASEKNGIESKGPSRHEPASDIGDGFMNIPDGIDDEELPF